MGLTVHPDRLQHFGVPAHAFVLITNTAHAGHAKIVPDGVYESCEVVTYDQGDDFNAIVQRLPQPRRRTCSIFSRPLNKRIPCTSRRWQSASLRWPMKVPSSPSWTRSMGPRPSCSTGGATMNGDRKQDLWRSGAVTRQYRRGRLALSPAAPLMRMGAPHGLTDISCWTGKSPYAVTLLCTLVRARQPGVPRPISIKPSSPSPGTQSSPQCALARSRSFGPPSQRRRRR